MDTVPLDLRCCYGKAMTGRRAFLFGLSVALFAKALAASAQPARRVHRIGLLTSSAAETGNTLVIWKRLHELGWTEGQNLVIEKRFAGPDRERLTAAARELAALQVDAIITGGGAETPEIAMSATKTIPIVFAMADDPVRLGLVRNLSRPEGNVTGVTSMNAELDAKRLELLREVLPRLRRVGLMWSPIDPSGSAVMSAAESAARSLNVQIEPLPIRQPGDIASAFATARSQALEAVMVLGTPIMLQYQRRVAEVAATAAMPTISGWRQLPEAGGLLSYGANLGEMFRRLGEIVDKILRGAKPTAVPVERPTKLELVINMKTAKALGLTVPHALLLRADNVIE